ncbi:hypothetical protein DFS34DRAFT_324481 [Phlyctochytrium arcticum]|nr:hypothetical protein DFS34DRAFT_324481 [Phlyctochytrium arcticum]
MPKARKEKHSKSDRHDSSGSKGKHPELTEEDYYDKSTEFQTWLRYEKKRYFEELSGDEARKYFAKFVRRWNKGKLQDRYYQGIAASEIPAAERSRHKWTFKNLNTEELDKARDSVDSLTMSAAQFTRPIDLIDKKDKAAAEARAARDNPSASRYDRDMERDRNDADREARHQQVRRQRQTHEAALDEIAPKPEAGREAQIAKRRTQNAWHKAERDVDAEVDDAVLMGGGSGSGSFGGRGNRDDGTSLEGAKRVQERRDQRRQEKMDEKSHALSGKVAAYQAKEDATLAMFRQLAEKRFGGKE